MIASFPSVPRDGADEKQHRRQLADGVNLCLRGKINCALDVTLMQNVTSTTIKDYRLSAQSVILLMPTTASAATAYVSGVWVSDQGNGTAKLNHASSAAADQSFKIAILG